MTVRTRVSASHTSRSSIVAMCGISAVIFTKRVKICSACGRGRRAGGGARSNELCAVAIKRLGIGQTFRY